MEELNLLGFWASPFSQRVIWALKLKGIKYEYLEEDLPNKSQLLLQSNPIHKKIPVLIHAGNPIAESLVILEYIEESWPHHNLLLPSDAFEKAQARFWIKYGEDMGPTFCAFFRTIGEEQEKARKEAIEALKILEEQGLGDKKYFGGDTINLVDIYYGWLPHWFETMEHVIGIQVIQPGTLPLLHQWILNFKEIPIIKQNLPDSEKLFDHLRCIREKFVADLVNK